jgi:hypothetical protein
VKEPGLKARALLLVARHQTEAGRRKAALRTLGRALKVAGAMPEDDLGKVRDRWQVLAMIAGAQAEAGDVAAARKAADAIGLPKGNVEGVKPGSDAGDRGYAYRLIAGALARAGKYREAERTAGRIDEQVAYLRAEALVDVAAARAKARDWKGARRPWPGRRPRRASARRPARASTRPWRRSTACRGTGRGTRTGPTACGPWPWPRRTSATPGRRC